jgi:transposase
LVRLSLGSKISGGKRLSGKTKPVVNRAAMALRMAAGSLYKPHCALGAYYRRMKARLGAPKAITATAHKLARLVYSMLKHGTEYTDVGQDYYEQSYKSRVIKNLKKRAWQLVYELVESMTRLDFIKTIFQNWIVTKIQAPSAKITSMVDGAF